MTDIVTIERTLEDMIDAHTAEVILGAIANICAGKAEHIRANWQDNTLARQWNVLFTAVSRAAVVAEERRL